MLKRLHLRNFTVFADANFEFGPGLNVMVGANGTGKSHVLKAGYALLYNLLHRLRTGTNNQSDSEESSQKTELRTKLINVFQPVPASDEELIRRPAKNMEALMEVMTTYHVGQFKNTVTFSPKKSHTIYTVQPEKWGTNIIDPIFIPAKEVLTLSWLLSLYDYRRVHIDETYPDLLRLLAIPSLRELEPKSLPILQQLRQLINGDVEESFGRFYLSVPDQPQMEMNMVAEGMRKFATLYKLLANGTLTPETTLFWDEPEANLNPALLKEMAAVLAELARAGFQIILATHSLFLLKEFHILSQQAKLPVRYFGLSSKPGEATTVTTTDNLELLPDIVALDAELDQSDRFQRVLDQEDADRN